MARIDPRTRTRLSTAEERALAARALASLELHRNRIVLAPAPVAHFDGHSIRVVESRNPSWYRDFSAPFWRSQRSFQLKRSRVERALRRVVVGRVRGNGYERRLLPHLAAWLWGGGDE